MPLDLFSPIGATVSLAVTSTTGSVALTSVGTAPVTKSVRIYNAGTATAFFTFGISDVVAVAATSMPIPSGGIETFELGPNVTHAAAITSSGTATAYFTVGRGA